MKTGLFKKIVIAGLFLIPFWFLFLSTLVVWFVQHNSYEQIQNWFRLRWPDAYDPAVFFNQNFTLAQYELLNKYSTLLFIFLGAVILLLIWFRKHVWIFFDRLYEDIIFILRLFRKTFISLSRKEKLIAGVLFLSIVCYRFYFFMEHTMHTDETASCLFYARQGLLHCSVNYVSTNNHVFFNILASVINSFFSFLPPKLIIRLPSLLADLFLWYGLFCIINKFGGFRRAIFIVAGTCFCYIVSYYATQGRGYKLQEVFVVVSLISFWAYFIYGSSLGKGHSLLVVSLVLGSYTNPLFIYHLLGILLLGSYISFVLKKIPADELMKNFIVLAGFTILVYLPVLLVNGIHGFVENRNAPTQNWQNLVDKIPFLIGVINYNFSLGKASVYILLMGSALFSYLVFSRRIKDQFYMLVLYYFLSLVLSIVLVSLYKKVYPPERGMSYFVLLALRAIQAGKTNASKRH